MSPIFTGIFCFFVTFDFEFEAFDPEVLDIFDGILFFYLDNLYIFSDGTINWSFDDRIWPAVSLTP